ncbi:MAG: efflux RND transporter permease subunit, partial [Lentisphaerales bacterium]
LDTLARLASRIKAAIKDVPGVVDLRDDIELSRSEFQFHVDRQRAALLGVDTRVVGNFLRSAVQGETPSKFRAGEDEYDITIRLPEDQRASYELFDQLRVVSRSGALVPLSSLGRAELAGGKGAIQRKNQSRAVTISANNQEREVDVILADVREIVSRIDLPRGYSVRYRGKTEDMNESSAFLKRAFGIALALIAVVLVIQFNSALLPGIILLSVLLSLVGVMWGLMICRMRFGVIMTGIGVISLAGVVVNNAIVLIDCIHHRVAAGLSVRDAVIAGGRLRLRPVLLTAATTILGLIPMATGVSLEIHRIPWAITTGSETTEWWAPMAVAIIFGLAVATMLTLVLVPVMYSLIDSFVQALRRLVGLGSEHAS